MIDHLCPVYGRESELEIESDKQVSDYDKWLGNLVNFCNIFGSLVSGVWSIIQSD